MKKMSKPAPKREPRRLIELEPGIAEAVDQHAKRERRSLKAQVNLILDAWLDEQGSDRAAA